MERRLESDVLAASLDEALIIGCFFGPIDFLDTRDRAVGWLMFLDRCRFPWRPLLSPAPSLEAIDEAW